MISNFLEAKLLSFWVNPTQLNQILEINHIQKYISIHVLYIQIIFTTPNTSN